MSQPKPCNSLGIQYGFSVWSISQYAWIGGTGAGEPPPPPQEDWDDNFNDNSMNVELWDVALEGDGTIVNETNNRLECTLPQASGTIAGYLGKIKKDVTDKQITIDVGDISGNAGTKWLQISNEHVRGANNRYAIMFVDYGLTLRFRRYLDGVITTVAEITTVGLNITKLRLVIDGTNISAWYYDGTWHNFGNESWTLASKECYLAVYGSGNSYDVSVIYLDNLVEEAVP